MRVHCIYDWTEGDGAISSAHMETAKMETGIDIGKRLVCSCINGNFWRENATNKAGNDDDVS